MRLKKWFNFKYLYQNFKKSKSLLIFLLCVIPFINLWMVGVNLLSKNYVIDFYDLSTVTSLIAFLLPLLLAFVLLGFVFKKSTVDFIMSKPITRKQIYGSNILGGIAFIFIIILLNTIGFTLLGWLTDLFIPAGAILDYFIYWLVTYIFVFIASVIGISVAGNIISFLVVVALILFLYPCFTLMDYSLRYENSNNVKLECNDEACLPDEIYCVRNETCLANLENGEYIYDVDQKYDSTLSTPVNYYNEGVANASVIKTIILSIIYLIGGYFIFKYRKMENSEVGFKNKYLYKVIKFLTFIPVTYISYVIYSSDTLLIFLAVIICISYYFIYDLIIKRELTNILKTLLEAILVSAAFMLIYVLVGFIYSINPVTLRVPDEITVEFYNENTNYYPEVVIKDKDLINEIIQKRDEPLYTNITVDLGSGYYVSRQITEEVYNRIMDYADDNNLGDEYTIDNIIHITSSSNQGLVIPNTLSTREMIVDYLDSYNESVSLASNVITLYKYEDHELKKLSIDIIDDLELLNYVKNIFNDSFLENFDGYIWGGDPSLGENFGDIIQNNEIKFLQFLREHKYDELTNDVIKFYSGVDMFYINRSVLEEFLVEYGDANEEQSS